MKMISRKFKIIAFLFILLPLIKANAINLDFSDNALVSCNQSDNDAGKYCIYNVASGVYAKVSLVREFNADVTAFDDNNYGEDKAFQPIVVGIANKNWGYGEFKITFWKDSSATQPLYIDQVQATAVDVDGDGAGNEKEGAGFFNFISYTIESNTNLDKVEALKNNNLYRFSSTNYTNQSGIDYTKTENMVSVLYKKVHTIVYRAYVYNNLDSGNTSGRLFSIYFGDSYNGNPFPNWSNPQTTTVGVNISGRIIEDINGDAQIQSTDVGINGFIVKAYMDDGDSIPEDTETVRYDEITGEYNGERGFYSFTVPINRTYWIAINSKNIPASAGLNSGFSRGDIWAEQTYGGNYVLCDTDADSSTAPVQLTQGGACYGGRNGDISDGFYDGSSKLSQAEHLAKIDANTSDITDVDFGFSFNVVTNINDQDDEDIDGNNRTCQGCFRQFIQNANAISGANSMRFVPAVPLNESNWWKIVLNITSGTANNSDDYALPPITDSYTTIDGTAYDYRDGTTVRNTNTGTSGHGGEKVGVGDDGLENTGDEAQLPSYNNPELEIDVDDRGHGITIKANNTTIKNIAIQHSGDDKPDTALIRVESGTGNLIEGCFIGTKADGSNPNTISRLGINIFYGSTTNIKGNYIAFLSDTGIQMEGEGIVEYNDIYSVGYLNSCGDGISTEFIHDSSGTRNKNNLVFRFNRIENTAAYGIETWGYPGAMTALNNTILNTGQGDKDGNLCGDTSTGFEQGGIRVFGIGNEIIENLIHDVPGNGIVLVSVGDKTKQNLISKNVFYNTGGISIDIDLTHSSGNPNGDGVSSNNGVTDTEKINIELDYPVITKAEIADGTLHVTGYIGTSSQKITGDHKIEIYKADDDGNNNGEIEQGDGKSVAHGDGRYYIGSCITNNDGTFDCSISTSSVSVSDGDLITATSIDSNNNTSEFGANTQVQPASVTKIISGHIYEDVNGDGDLSDKQPIEGTVVKLYKLDGTEIGTSVTNVDGEFSFSVSEDNDYYVVVDSKSISPSASLNSGYDQSYVWAEQTYGPKGSYCDTDADSSTDPSEISSAGVCFGGAYGDRSDGFNDGNNNYDLSKSEHYAKVSVSGNDVTGLDFGFSFNVVTNINDQDDDPNNSRTCQGCFRQFIQNANAISDSNTLRFVPVVQANKTNYWSITADKRMSSSDPYSTDNTEPIFRIEDSDTVIDGTAYDYRDGTTILDKNSSVWAGKSGIGSINTCSIDMFYKPELEIFTNARYLDDNNENAAWDPYNNGTSASIFYVKGDNFTLKNISAYGGHYVVFVDEANNPTIKDNFLGIPATGLSDPGDGKRSNRGVAVATQDSTNTINGLVEHNLIGYTRLHGIFTYKFNGQDNFVIRKNVINFPSKGWNYENGIGLEEGTQRIKVYCNEVSSSCGVGIETWKSEGKHTIESNTVVFNGLACAEDSGSSQEKIGIRITSSDNIIRYNKIFNNKGPGIMVAYDSGRGFSPKRNLISKNSFKGNDKVGIDLLKDGENSDGLYTSGQSGVTPNNGQKDTDIGNEGIDYPVFTLATLSNGNLHLEGYIGIKDNKLKPQAGETWTIEIYKADDDGNNNGEIEQGDGKSVAHGEGYEYIGSITLTDADFDSNNNFSKDLTVTNLNVGEKITAITIDNNNNTSEFSANIEVLSNAIYGYIYHDGYNPYNQSYTKPNGNKDGYEKWTDKTTAPTVYIKLCDNNGNVISIKEISDGDGFYKFENLQNGDYTVIEDTDNDTNNCSPSDPSQWISTTPNSASVTINGNSVNVNFGDFHGSKVSGIVFEDKGNGTVSSSDANNGLFNPSIEKGIDSVELQVCQTEDCSSVLSNTLTNKNGEYVLFIPYDNTYEGKTIYLVEKDKTGYTSTGNTKDNTVAYKNPDNSTVKERNIIDFIVNSGNVYSNYNFGDVKVVNIQPENSYSVPSGSSLTIKHTITVNTPGSIAVSLNSDRNLVYLIYNDTNCDGISDGSPINPQGDKYLLNNSNPVPADTNYCIVIKTVIPTDIPDGSVDKLQVSVYEDWINTDTEVFDDEDLVKDTITVSTEENGLIYLEKAVKNISQNGSYTKRNQAKPCEILEYRISFKNIGSRKVKELVISDNIPIETRFNYASYNGDDVKIVFGSTNFSGKVSENPDTDGVVLENNTLKVYVNKVTGKEFIEPGEEGYILYQVIIKGRSCE